MDMTVNSLANNELQRNFLQVNATRDQSAVEHPSERLQSQINELQQNVEHTSDMDNLARTADDGLASISEGLQQLSELSIRANSVLTDDDRSILQNEAQQILGRITDTVEAVSFNDQRLLDGTFSGSVNSSSRQISIGDMSVSALGLEDFDVASPVSQDAINSALDTVAGQRSELGSISNTFAHTIDSDYVSALNLAASRSSMVDPDIPQAVSDSSRERIFQEYRMAMQAFESENMQSAATAILQASI